MGTGLRLVKIALANLVDSYYNKVIKKGYQSKKTTIRLLSCTSKLMKFYFPFGINGFTSITPISLPVS